MPEDGDGEASPGHCAGFAAGLGGGDQGPWAANR